MNNPVAVIHLPDNETRTYHNVKQLILSEPSGMLGVISRDNELVAIYADGHWEWAEMLDEELPSADTIIEQMKRENRNAS